jgi:hypothetical protein
MQDQHCILGASFGTPQLFNKELYPRAAAAAIHTYPGPCHPHYQLFLGRIWHLASFGRAQAAPAILHYDGYLRLSTPKPATPALRYTTENTTAPTPLSSGRKSLGAVGPPGARFGPGGGR